VSNNAVLDGGNSDGMDGLVQQLGETLVDANRFHDWADLANSLPDHHRVIRLRVRSSVPQKGAVDGGIAIRHQPRGEPDLHSHPIRDAKSAFGSGGHPDRLGNDHLDDGGDLEALPLGGGGSGAVLRLGVDCDGVATVDYVEQLGKLIT
jgi:hypothetical protein